MLLLCDLEDPVGGFTIGFTELGGGARAQRPLDSTHPRSRRTLSTLTRSGQQRTLLAAPPADAVAVLRDPAAVTALLGDLLDQSCSTAGPPGRWVLPPITAGHRDIQAVVEPRFACDEAAGTVTIHAVSTPESDADVVLDLHLDTRPVGGSRSVLQCRWTLQLAIPVPRLAVRLATPAIDGTVRRTVQRIMDRTAAAVAGEH